MMFRLDGGGDDEIPEGMLPDEIREAVNARLAGMRAQRDQAYKAPHWYHSRPDEAGHVGIELCHDLDTLRALQRMAGFVAASIAGTDNNAAREARVTVLAGYKVATGEQTFAEAYADVMAAMPGLYPDREWGGTVLGNRAAAGVSKTLAQMVELVREGLAIEDYAEGGESLEDFLAHGADDAAVEGGD